MKPAPVTAGRIDGAEHAKPLFRTAVRRTKQLTQNGMTAGDMATRDRSFVDFVLRYRLATNRVIASQLLPGRSMNAVAKVTARLTALTRRDS